MAAFQSPVFILPGLGNSEETHWQSLWEKEHQFTRILQTDWNTPVCDDWLSTINEVLTVSAEDLSEVILVAHSLACTTIAAWARRYHHIIKAALLVAPSDTESPAYPSGTTGFIPMTLYPLPFRSIVVASSNDPFVSLERAQHFARCWESEWVNIGQAGHINVASGFGPWPFGLQLLEALDKGTSIHR
jgi:predicted alpha/beta hydrolase family esterase